MKLSQFDQIAEAIRALPDSDEKANLVSICTNNFCVTFPQFLPFRFVQHCYVKIKYDASLKQLEERSLKFID